MALRKFRLSGSSLLFATVLIHLLVELARGRVILVGKDLQTSFDDVDANFTPEIKESGENGVFYLAEPLNACSSLRSRAIQGSESSFVLIIRGGCTFDEKIRRAQEAGFKAAIVYDNEYMGALLSMAGNPEGIDIHAVFVSRVSGEILKKYAGQRDLTVWLIPSVESSAWSVMAISFILLLAFFVVLATCFFVRRHQIRRDRHRASRIQEFHGMSRHLVKAMPIVVFTTVLEDNCTSRTCAICLEDYNPGEKLRVLPCQHKFHASCVDSWLTTWRTFCPVCKQDARLSTSISPASERTPLLPNNASSPHSSFRLASINASLAEFQRIQVDAGPTSSATTSWSCSLSSHSHIPSLSGSNNSLPYLSRSSTDLGRILLQRSHMCYPTSPHPHGLAFTSANPRLTSSLYIPSSSHVSSWYSVEPSGQQPLLRYCSEPGASLFAQSLRRH
ncbi:putative transcription factor C2H2 family [Dioscorea sansibarensis]